MWREALAAAGLPHNEPANQSLIWNGDFARDFLNGGLDWRWSSPFGASIGFDAPPPSSGGRSLRLDFSGGANLDLSGASRIRSGRAQPQLPFSRGAENGRNHDRERNLFF